MAYSTYIDLLEAAQSCGSIGMAAAERESFESELPIEDLRAQAHESLDVMRAAIERGLAGDTRSATGLVGTAGQTVAAHIDSPVVSPLFAKALSYSLATAEVNASMGRIVAAPTGGASGVLPGVLFALGDSVEASEDTLIDALFCAGGIGSVIASKATLSGAAGGCQAEVGSASAMAAAAGVQLLGGSPEASGHAASFALQGQMGLVCDPVCGLVEIPCVARNATGASVALGAIELAMAGVTFPIPFDEVVDAMSSVGRSMPPTLRETAHGGLAITHTARQICSRMNTNG